MNLQEMIQKYIKNGYSDEFASSKVSQDLILTAIANSKYIQNITIKGGVVMHNLSNDKRRATRDLDLDFIKYSLDNNSIINFISELNNSINSINFEIMDEIVSLHHQDYKGKRVFLKIKDNYKNEIDTKLDIGVHKLFELEQEQYMFDFSIINLGANLLINSPEQIFTEKMKSQYHDTENKTPKLQYIIAFWRFRVGYFIHKYPRISCFCPTDIVLPASF